MNSTIVAPKSLDNTLRYMYYSLWNTGAKLVAIEFEHDGKVWRVDTVEEAVRLRDALRLHDARAKNPVGESWNIRENSIWTPDLFQEFIESTKAQQRAFLWAVHKKPMITGEELTKKLHLGSEVGLAGVLSGLSKQLKKMSLKPHQVYQVIVEWHGKDKERLFDLTPEFELAIREVGWSPKK